MKEKGCKMRIIIDGTVGAGKTTLITGMSQRDIQKKKYPGISDLGYPVFTDMMASVIRTMRADGISDPAQDWPLFFEIAVNRCVSDYNRAEKNQINFYDRGIYFLEVMAELYNQKLPERYYEFCETNRYDNPVFIFEPILSIDMTKPHEMDNKQKVYTVEQRMQQHYQIMKIYEEKGYNVIIIPLKSEDPYENNIYRLNLIKKKLGLFEENENV